MSQENLILVTIPERHKLESAMESFFGEKQ